MQKKALLALLLAMTLLLSGCALIVKDPEVDAQTVIIRMGDKTVTKEKVQQETNVQLYNTANLYSMYFGSSYDTTNPDNIASAQDAAIEALEKDMVIRDQIAKQGITLTEDEEKEALEDGQSEYDSELEFAQSYYFPDSELDEETLKAEAAKKLESLNYNLEYYQNAAKDKALEDKLRESVIKDVAVTDEEIQKEYEDHVAESKESYESNAGSYASAVNNGTTVYFAPEGVRRVKQILVKFHDDDQEAIDAAKSKVTEANTKVTAAQAKIDEAQKVIDDAEAPEESKTEAQTDKTAAELELAEANTALDAAQKEETDVREKAFANLDEETDAILAEIAGGADWDTLMAEKNQDPGMQSGETAEKGYAIAEGMTSFDAAFVDAGMALEKIGDTSGKIRGDAYGYYIIRYVADEPAGEIGLDAVKEDISSELLEDKQTETYNNQIDQWIADAGFQVDKNALKD